MQVHHKPTKILIVGMSGSGKSTYQTRYVLNTSDKFRHCFIFDHKLEFQERCRIPACFSIDEVLERVKKNERFLSYHGSQEFPGDSERAFQFFSRWSFEIASVLQTKCLFVADEVNRFTTSYDMGDDFKLLVEDGRLQGLDFCGTTHAANQISNRLRLQLTEIVALRTREKIPLQFLEEQGFDPEEVYNLKTGQFITLNLDQVRFVRGKLFENNACPEPETPPTVKVEPEPSPDPNPAATLP
jgi:GTPase SAR1 family protein